MSGNQQPDGSKTFVWGTVTSVLFNIPRQKRAGGTYQATVLNYMDNQGQAKDQAWASQVIDNPMNATLRATLVDLYGKPGAPITIHKTKQNGYWNVTRIDLGHVQGERSQAQAAAALPVPGAAPVPAGAPPGYAGPAPAAPQAAPGYVSQPAFNADAKMRSKEQCIRGEAIQAASTCEIALVAHRGAEYKFDLKRVLTNAETLSNYITNGLAQPVAAPAAQPAAPVAAPAAPVASPAPVAAPPAPAYPQAPPAPTPAPQGAYAPPALPAPAAPVAAPAPAPAPAYPQAPAAAPGAPAPVAAPQAFDDGFGGP